MRERRRLTKILAANPKVNNGSHLGGLAFALQSAMQGYQTGKDDDQYRAAQEALASGLAPTTTPNAGEMGPIRPRGGRLTDALTSLSGLEGNPYAAELSSQLGLQQASMEQQQSAMRDQRAFEDQRYSQRTAEENEEWERRNAIQSGQAKEIAAMRAAASSGGPAAVQEWQYFVKLSPEQQQQFLALKRNPQFLNLGDQFLRPDALNPGQTIDARGVGRAPDRKITDDRIITAPSLPGGVPGGRPPQGVPQAPGGLPGGQINAPVAPQGGLTAQPQGLDGPMIQNLPASPEEVRRLAETQRLKGEKFSTVDSRFQQIQDNLDGSFLPTTGMVGGQVLSNLGGTAAHDIAADLDTIKGIIGFGELQAMRAASPTGGALGQVSEMENRLLQAQYGSLAQSQSEEQFRRNLQTVRDTFNRVVHEGISEQEAMAALNQMGQGGGQAAPHQQQPQPSQQGGWSIQRVE